jgi:hypothetical protein
VACVLVHRDNLEGREWGTGRHSREWVCFTATSKHGKCQDENTDIGATIQGCGYDVVVFGEVLWAAPAEPPLCKEAKDVVTENGGIDSYAEPAESPDNDRQVDIGEEFVRPDPVHQPEWNRNEKADHKREGHPLVARSDGVHVIGNTPRNSQRVELVGVNQFEALHVGKAEG